LEAGKTIIMVTHDPRAARKAPLHEGTWRREFLPVLLRLLFRNLLRHKLRTGLTLCGICVAILSFVFFERSSAPGMPAWKPLQPTASSPAIPFLSFFPSSLLSGKDSRGRGGQERFLRATGSVESTLKKELLRKLRGGARTYLELYSEYLLPEDQKQVFLRDRRACIVGRKLAKTI